MAQWGIPSRGGLPATALMPQSTSNGVPRGAWRAVSNTQAYMHQQLLLQGGVAAEASGVDDDGNYPTQSLKTALLNAQMMSTDVPTQSRGTKRPGCWYFLRGLCSKGATCPFSHLTDALAEAAADDDANTPPCWYYERGACTNGANCAFRHVGIVLQSANSFKKLKMGIELFEPEDDNIYTAVKVALEPASEVEKDDNLRKLRTKIAKYARDAVEGLELDKGEVGDLINTYADNFLTKIFQGMADRPWLPQADMLLVIDAAVKELFPQSTLSDVTPDELESLIFCAHDRAMDEQRSLPAIWEAIQTVLQGPKVRNKVYKACELSRKDVATNLEVQGAESFLHEWISRTVHRLRDECQGYPETVLSLATATELFSLFPTVGALPTRCMSEDGSPADGWQPMVAAICQECYRRRTPTLLGGKGKIGVASNFSKGMMQTGNAAFAPPVGCKGR